jgi:hypothetical protein
MYKWIDSCCIDKSSSAELSEAINSMYKWYTNAQVCYVYLCDVDAHEDVKSALRLSQWFTRGWTLQEILAPRIVEFYDRNWIEIGTKQSMSGSIAKITGIDSDHLFRGIRKICIAQKMSWVARRKTTRAEDLAYCLMGLFNVNMPLLYGEGAQKAFIRLQTEIMATTIDESIFAWSYTETDRRVLPLLAEHPSWFINSNKHTREELVERSSMNQMTSMGLRIEASCIPSKGLNEKLQGGETEGFLMPLNSCTQASYNYDFRVLVLQMIKISWDHPSLNGGAQEDGWYRLPDLKVLKLRIDNVEHLLNRDKKVIYVPQIELPQSISLPFKVRTLVRTRSLAEYSFTLIDDNGWSRCTDHWHLLGQNTQGDLILEYHESIFSFLSAVWG